MRDAVHADTHVGIHAVHAEWTKLRTLPSTWWLLMATVALTVALGAAATASLSTAPCADTGGCREDTVKLALTGVWLGQSAVVVLAVLAMSGEYGTGTIRTSLTALPHRLRLLAAKATVVSAAAIAAGTLGVGGSLIAGRFALPTDGFDPLPLDEGATLRAAVGTVLYLGLIALLSLGVAAALRDTAAAVTCVLTLLYAFPILAGLLSDPDWEERARRFGPATAGMAIQATRDLDQLPIAPWPGLAVVAGYAVVALGVGGALLRARDA